MPDKFFGQHSLFYDIRIKPVPHFEKPVKKTFGASRPNQMEHIGTCASKIFGFHYRCTGSKIAQRRTVVNAVR